MVTSSSTSASNSEEQALDELIAKAVEAAAKGENAEQLLEVMLATLPSNAKEAVRKKFVAALTKRGLRTPSGEADIPSRATLARMRTALSVSARQMMDRVLQLVRARPDLADAIKQAGQVLASNGVRNDKVTVSETDLGAMAPLATSASKPTQDRGGRTA